jgi:F0F1-type ATP synthase delta subunit
MKTKITNKKLVEKLLKLAKKTGASVLAKKLVLLAKKSNNLTFLKNLVFSLQEQEAKEEGKKLLVLTLSQPISQRTEEEIIKAICREFLLKPTDLYIVRRYSKRLKAGFQARLEDYILDLSLTNSLNKLREVFKNEKIFTDLT